MEGRARSFSKTGQALRDTFGSSFCLMEKAVGVGINNGSYESPNGETTDRAILPIYYFEYLNIKIPRYENYLTRI
jgi:hypothetical protein